MPTTITMPQLGETVTEGTVAQWLKKPGDSVEKYEAFVEVSTDKVNAEVPSPVTGVIRELIVKEGETVPTGAPIAIIDDVAARTPAPGPFESQDDTSPSEQVAADRRRSAEANHQASDEPVPGGNVGLSGPTYNAPGSNGRPRRRRSSRTTAPRHRAQRHAHLAGRAAAGARAQIDLARVSGTGANGRITANDILAAAKAGPSAGVAATITADNAEYTAPALTRLAHAAPPPKAAGPRNRRMPGPSRAISSRSRRRARSSHSGWWSRSTPRRTRGR